MSLPMIEYSVEACSRLTMKSVALLPSPTIWVSNSVVMSVSLGGARKMACSGSEGMHKNNYFGIIVF